MTNRLVRDPRLWFLAAIAAALAIAFVAMDGLSSEVRKDEYLNWPTALHFSGGVGVTVEQLRGSQAPSGPLPFWVWGQLERLTGHGLVAGRILNALLTLMMVALIVCAADAARKGILAAIGLLLCPYVVGVGVHLYSDPATIFFLVLGMWAWRRERHFASAIAMALAIACRQFAVAVPAALVAVEGLRWLRTGRRLAPTAILPWGAQALACATLLVWIAIWGGLAPPAAVARFDVWTASVWRLVPRNALYALTCVGAYFVVVEMLLFRRWRLGGDGRPLVAIIGAGVVAALFIAFPPLGNTDYAIETMGYLDKAARLALPDLPRMFVFWALAAVALARFRPNSIAAVLICVQVVVMLKAQVGWDKYNMPLLAALWFLASTGRIDEAVLAEGDGAGATDEPAPG